MYREAARWYDLIHDARGRNARAEADLVLGELRRRHPRARSLLDVACGTGAHLPRFAEQLDVVGLDASDDMLAVASERAPGVRLERGDMRRFSLGRSFDAIVCLFSGIGYLTEEPDLRQAIDTMAAHLAPGGVLMIEGWVEPDYWIGTTVRAEAADGREVAVARVARSSRDGAHCHIAMRYDVALPDSITTIDEQHTMRLSDPAEFAAAYEHAGLSFERLPHMLHPGRSLYVGASPEAAAE